MDGLKEEWFDTIDNLERQIKWMRVPTGLGTRLSL